MLAPAAGVRAASRQPAPRPTQLWWHAGPARAPASRRRAIPQPELSSANCYRSHMASQPGGGGDVGGH
eukprot:4709562-Alexandrium_andersonii.AAC.1